MDNKTDIIFIEDVVSKIDGKKLNDDTVNNVKNDIIEIKRKIEIYKSDIEKCVTEEDFDNIDINLVLEEGNYIIQSALSINGDDLKLEVENLNQIYRSLEILYFNKKISILRNTITDITSKTEKDIKDLTGGTLFSIASVFLGISLTSALVAGVEFISPQFTLLYFMTCLLIVVFCIGFSSIFIRNNDGKSIVIIVIMILVSLIWGMTAYYTYRDYNNGNKVEQNDNVIINQDLYIEDNNVKS